MVQNTRTIARMCKVELDLDELTTHLCAEENDRTQRNGTVTKAEKALAAAERKKLNKQGPRQGSRRGSERGSKDGGKEGSMKRFKGECFYCHKVGHMKADCCKRKSDQERNSSTADEKSEAGFIATEAQGTPGISTWILDSGATSHMTSQRGLFNGSYVELHEPRTVSTGFQIARRCAPQRAKKRFLDSPA
jgi:hypothetical protein